MFIVPSEIYSLGQLSSTLGIIEKDIVRNWAYYLSCWMENMFVKLVALGGGWTPGERTGEERTNRWVITGRGR